MGFPAYLPNLRTWRARWGGRDRTLPPLFSQTLTTLSLSNGYQWFDCWCSSLHYPNLRILCILYTGAQTVDLFNFIRRNVKLREVTINFEDQRHIRTEGFVKLLGGSGRWKSPSSPEETDHDAYAFLDNAEIDPDAAVHSVQHGLGMSGFGFIRTLRTSARSTGGSSPLPHMPQYDTTTLALCLEGFFRHEQFIDFFSLSAHFPLLQELRLTTSRSISEGTFAQFMSMLQSQLNGWHNLRRLSLEWAIHGSWQWGLIEGFVEPVTAPSSTFDQLLPPLLNYDVISESDSDIEAVEEILGLTEDEIDLDDPSILMCAWEERNRHRVEKVFRAFAEVCPTLEEIRWHLKVMEYQPETVAWHWRILRNQDGSVRVMHELLAWTGRLQGDPSPIEIIVGEEQEYQHMHVRKAMRGR